MCKLGMYTTRMSSVLVAVGTVVSCPTYAADRAVIEVRGDSKAEVMWFRSGAVLFTDRGFRLTDFPAALAGEKFLRSSIDATEFDVVRGGRLIVLTPQLIPGAASQAEALEKQGFVRTKEDRFQLFETREIDQVLVYEKQTTAGESYRFGKWTVVLGFEDARSARNRTRAAEGKPFFVYPADIPNTGVLFVDRQKEDHSGHGHNSIA